MLAIFYEKEVQIKEFVTCTVIISDEDDLGLWNYHFIKKKKSLGHFSSARRYVAWVCNTVYACMIIYLVIFRLYIACSYCIIFTDVSPPPQATEESITECKLEKSEKSSYLQEHCSMLHDILMNIKPVCSFQVCLLLVYVNYHYYVRVKTPFRKTTTFP